MGPVGDRVFIVQHGAGALCSPRSSCKATCPSSPTQSRYRQLHPSAQGPFPGSRISCQGPRSPCQGPRSACQGSLRARALCDGTPIPSRRNQSGYPDAGSPTPQMPIRRKNGSNGSLHGSLKATRKENDQSEKTIKDIELAVKAVHNALACNRAKVAARCLSPPPPEATTLSRRPSTDQPTHLTTRSLAAARSAAKQKQYNQELRSPRGFSPRAITAGGDDPLGGSIRSLADARDQRKIEKQAVERSVSFNGGLLEKLEDMQKIAVASSGGKMLAY